MRSSLIPSHLPQWRREYPFRSYFFNLSEEHRLHYIDEGKDEGKGETLIFLHGNPTWSFAFRKLIGHFKSTHRCLALDQLGMGLSSKKNLRQMALEERIEHTLQWIDSLELKSFTLILHDWGGAIGMGVALARLHQVKKIILMNTAAFNSKDIPKRIDFCRRGAIGPYLMKKMNLFPKGLVLMGTRKPLTQVARAGYLTPFRAPDERLGPLIFVRDIPTQKNHPSYKTLKELEKQYEQLKCPLLFLWGERDFCFHPGFLKKWEELFPAAKVTRFSQAGHLVFEDEPEKVIFEMEKFL